MAMRDFYVDPKLLVGTASLLTYLYYKQVEPSHPAVHAALLVVVPASISLYLNAKLSLLQDIAVVLSHWALILTFTTLYRLSPFHPLAKYPGPLFGKLSKFYLAYYNARGNSFTLLKSLHQRYGDVVRIGPNELSFCGADAIQPIYVSKIMTKGPYYDFRTQDDLGTQLDGVRDYTVHAARRKPWAKAMGTANIKDYEEVIVKKSHELLEELTQREGQVVDVSHWLGLYSFDFMGQLIFGRDFGILKAGEDHTGLIHMLDKGVYCCAIISQFPWIQPLLSLIPGINTDLITLRRKSAQFASERTKAGSQIKDLYYFMMDDDSGAQSGANPGEIIADAILAMVAGSDTTAIILSHLMYYMMRQPECVNRLRKELDAAFPNGEEPVDFTLLADLPYLNACINEALRLLPPTLGGLQRRVEFGTGGVMIGSHFVPEGTQVFVHFYSLHRNPQEFSPLTDTFWPERWLTQDSYVLPTGDVISKDQVVTNRAAFIPFGVGQQNCVGKGVAQVEMRAVFAALMQKFNVTKAKGYDLDTWEKDLVDVFVALRGSLPVILTSRETS